MLTDDPKQLTIRRSEYLNAAENGNIEKIKEYIFAKVIPIDIQDKGGYNALHYACTGNHIDIVRYLINYCHIDIHIKTKTGWNALHIAIREGHMAIVQYLIKKCKIKLYSQIHHGVNELHIAAFSGHTDIVKYLIIACQMKIHEQDKNGRNALYHAISYGRIDIVKYLINDCNFNVNIQDKNGWNLLHCAAVTGRIDVVKYLIDCCQCDIGTRDKNGMNVLHMATAIGRIDIVKYFIEKCRMDIYVQEINGWNALHHACYKGHLNIVKYFINNCKCHTNIQTKTGWNALHIACYYGHIDIAKYLIEGCQMDIYIQDKNYMNALHNACFGGHLNIIQYLIDDCKCNLNIRDKNGCNVLHIAAAYGRFDIVKHFIQERHVDITITNNFDMTAYELANRNKKYDVAEYLSKVMKSCNKNDKNNFISNNRCGGSNSNNDNVSDNVTINPPTANANTNIDTITTTALVQTAPVLMNQVEVITIDFDNMHNKNDTMVDTKNTLDNALSPKIHIQNKNMDPDIVLNRQQLDIVVNDPLADPVVFSSTYLQDCTNNFTSKVLGEGAFGKVYYGCDKALGIKVAVKCVPLHVQDQNVLEQITISFKREIAVLKRFRHPNIVTLYGYNVTLNQANQFLVYEYLSNGALSTLLMDEKGRTRLPGNIRLSLMYQLARSIHFLHTGGCDNLIIFHRDIKSGNICLSHDFTAKLIDCGLAKFAPDNSNIVTPGSVTPTILKSSGAMVFGTPGYICPIYARGQIPYTAACDVYSIGVVFAELITGCLQGGQSSQYGKCYGDFFSRYIKDAEDEPIENGWAILMEDNDVSAEWNVEILKRLCKITTLCMASSPKRRLSTADLVQRLSEISSIEFTSKTDSESVSESNEMISQEFSTLHVGHISDAESIMASDKSCVLCNRLRNNTIPCSNGHNSCIECVEQEIQIHIGKSGTGVLCKCGKIFYDCDLFGKINVSIYNCYIRERGLQKIIEEKLNNVTRQLHTITCINENNHETVMTMLTNIKSNIHRVLGGLSYLATNSVKKCPTLVWMVPADRAFSNSSKDWRKWVMDVTHKKYDMYFVCQHSFTVVDAKIEVEVGHAWLKQVGPVLLLGMLLLKTALQAGGLPALPFPIPNLIPSDQIKMYEDFVSSYVDDVTIGLLNNFQDLYRGQASNLPFDASCQLQTLSELGYEAIVAKATNLKRSDWKQAMQPVVNHHGSVIWVKNEYSAWY